MSINTGTSTPRARRARRDVAAVGVRQPEIQYDQLGRRYELPQQALGRGGDGNGVAVVLQGTLEDAADRRVVFAHHDESHVLTLDTLVPVLHLPWSAA
ncbi:hypothetical protein ACFQ0Q_47075 [Streptomyces aureus]